MHYYQFNIGDYKSHTSHLTIIEDIAYRRLLDMYYLHEKPLDNSISSVARLIGMREYESEVEMVLLEFFVCPDEGGWINPRADKEIAVYKGFSDAGKRGAAKRWLTGGDSHPIAPPIANIKHKPLNINHETLNNGIAPKRKNKTSLPDNFEPSKEHQEFAVTHSLSLADELKGFRLHHEAQLTTSGSWNASFSTWLRNAVKWRKPVAGVINNQTVAKVDNRCEYQGCTRMANTRTAKGHRCVEHISR